MLLACVGMTGCGDGSSPDPAQEAARVKRTEARLAALNERANAVPEGQRAWPVLRDVHAEIEWPEWMRYETFEGVDVEAARTNDASSVRWVDEHRPAIKRVVEASKLPGLGYLSSFDPVVDAGDTEGELLFHALLAHLGVLRQHARLLRLDARLALAEGDGQRFADNVTTIARLGDMAVEHDFIISQLVRKMILRVAADLVLEGIARGAVMREADLVRLDAMLGAILEACATGLRFDAAALIFEDTIDYVYDDRGRPLARGLNRLDEEPGALERSARRDHDEGVFAAWLTEAKAFVSVPAWEQEGDWPSVVLGDHVARAGAGREPLAFVTINMTPGLKAPIRELVNLQAAAGAARIMVAARRHQMRHDAWPESLSELDVDVLAEVPIDPYFGEGLGYGLRDGEPVVWSAGEDKDDDGVARRSGTDIWCTTPELERRLIERPDIDGDWVIYPPARDD